MKIAFEEMDKMSLKAMMKEHDALFDILIEFRVEGTNEIPDRPLAPVITLTIDGIRPDIISRSKPEIISCLAKRRDELREYLVDTAKNILNFFEEDLSCLPE